MSTPRFGGSAVGQLELYNRPSGDSDPTPVTGNFDWTTLPGFDQYWTAPYMGPDDSHPVVPIDAVERYLRDTGTQVWEEQWQPRQAAGVRYATDKDGNIAGKPQSYAYTDTMTEMMMPIMMALTGGIAGAMGGGAYGGAIAGGTVGAGSAALSGQNLADVLRSGVKGAVAGGGAKAIGEYMNAGALSDTGGTESAWDMATDDALLDSGNYYGGLEGGMSPTFDLDIPAEYAQSTPVSAGGGVESSPLPPDPSVSAPSSAPSGVDQRVEIIGSRIPTNSLPSVLPSMSMGSTDMMPIGQEPPLLDVGPIPEPNPMPEANTPSTNWRSLLNSFGKMMGASGGGGGAGVPVGFSVSDALRKRREEDPLPKMFDPNYKPPAGD